MPTQICTCEMLSSVHSHARRLLHTLLMEGGWGGGQMQKKEKERAFNQIGLRVSSNMEQA